LRRRDTTIRSLLGTFFTPLLHSSLFNRTSIRTSLVPIIFLANFLISFTARGARFLKLMLWSFLCRLMVYSRVTASLARRSFFTICNREGRGA
jgi:hypothetical protein